MKTLICLTLLLCFIGCGENAGSGAQPEKLSKKALVDKIVDNLEKVAAMYIQAGIQNVRVPVPKQDQIESMQEYCSQDDLLAGVQFTECVLNADNVGYEALNTCNKLTKNLSDACKKATAGDKDDTEIKHL
ncbi:MAG: hypothetical protein WCK49_00255 [Myxococcaceae bacterium]